MSYFADKPKFKKAFTELFAKIRDYSEGPLWSQGVRLTRNAEFLVDDRNPSELKVLIKRRGEPLSPKVTLFLDDLDWSCDIDSENDPCPNIIAAAISLNSGVGLSNAETQSLGFIKYCLYREGTSLSIKRLIQRGDSFHELERPLREIVGGEVSGRLDSSGLTVSKEDFAVEAALGMKKRGVILPDRMKAVLKALSVFPEIELDGKKILLSSSLPHAVVEVFKMNSSFQVSFKNSVKIHERFNNGANIVKNEIGEKTLHPSFKLLLGSEFLDICEPPGKSFSFKQLPKLKKEAIPFIRNFFEVDESEARYPFILEQDPQIELVMKKDGADLRVLPRITYGTPVVAESNGRELQVFSKNIFVERNLSKEKQLAVKLKQELSLQLDREVGFSGKDAVDFNQKAKSWKKSGEADTQFNLMGELRAETSLEENKDGSAFITTSFKVGSKHASFENAFKAWETNQPYVVLEDGGWAKLPEHWFETYGAQIKNLIEAQENKELGKKSLPSYLIPSTSQLVEELGGGSTESISDFKSRLENAQLKKDVTLPKDFNANLRDYQTKGVAWLQFLKAAKIGALLADDMGLGKTIQSICVLENKSLIVAPTSVLPSWQEQISKFRPSLKTNLYHGANRTLDEDSDITLTSFAILRNDIEILRDINWKVSIIDEAQNIKNSASQTAQAAFSIQSDFKICISGTPVENSLDDLWSQFHFLNPLLLDEKEKFRKAFKRPIALGDENAHKKLKRIIKPFLLRRKKSEVLQELPPKTEAILSCELPEKERALYDSIYASTKKEVLEKLDQKGGVFAALEALLRLRQASCHPALVPQQEASSSEKVKTLIESLQSSIQAGHRALVFSQWTSFLDLIEPHLNENKFSFSRLDGGTKDREKVIREFQSENGTQLMLLSLKAGGVGVTLTAADHIYLMDSWWNPAVEEQASDRAHRIGQKNPVFVYRLIAKDTVEENILKLQESKRELADSLLSETGIASQLSKEDIQNLFN